jgi:type I restriction enzyme S subunit
VTAKVVKGGQIQDQPAEFIAADFYDEWMRRGLPQQLDVLLTTEAPLGEVAIIRGDARIALAQRIILLRAKPKVLDAEYLFYALQSDFGQEELKARASGTTVLGIKQSELRKVRIPVPPLSTQQRIAGILSAYDELIENSQRRIKILESMAGSLYREWFIHFRFPGHEFVPLVPSALGDIPQGWEVKTVEEIVKRLPVGKKYEQKTVRLTGRVPVLDQGKTGVIGHHNDEPGVVASENSPVVVFANHTCYQRLIHFPFSTIQNVLPFVSSPLIPRNIYWLHWATNGLVIFNDYKGHWPEFVAQTLVVAPQVLCQQFGVFAAPLSIEILKLDDQIQNLRTTRDALLPRLLSGQIDVDTIDA